LDIIISIVDNQTPAILAAKVNAFIANTHGQLLLPGPFGFGIDFAYSAPPLVSDT